MKENSFLVLEFEYMDIPGKGGEQEKSDLWDNKGDISTSVLIVVKPFWEKRERLACRKWVDVVWKPARTEATFFLFNFLIENLQRRKQFFYFNHLIENLPGRKQHFLILILLLKSSQDGHNIF